MRLSAKLFGSGSRRDSAENARGSRGPSKRSGANDDGASVFDRANKNEPHSVLLREIFRELHTRSLELSRMMSESDVKELGVQLVVTMEKFRSALGPPTEDVFEVGVGTGRKGSVVTSSEVNVSNVNNNGKRRHSSNGRVAPMDEVAAATGGTGGRPPQQRHVSEFDHAMNVRMADLAERNDTGACRAILPLPLALAHTIV